MPGHRRVVQSVTPQDEGTGGRPYLYAYGRRWLADLAGVTARTVIRAIDDGLDVGDPVAVVVWALRRRGNDDLADQLASELRTKKT